MQSCLLVVRTNKQKSRKGKILFIDASNEVTDERGQSFLSTSNRNKILKAYLGFEEIIGFSSIASIDQVRGLNHNLNIPLYVRPASAVRESAQTSMDSLSQALEDWRSTSLECKIALGKAVPGLARTTPEPLIPSSGIPKWVDKSQWTRVKLGEVCEEVSERIDNPSGGPALRFVGLEHLDSGELKVRRWGTTENLESAMKVFKSGDILFARRNAYLKRASLADFNGVCSGDAIVLRENHDKLTPGFLSFVLNTGKFWEFAVANAAGTMSRRVNGKTLANYEFDLPPLDQQHRIADILWALDGSKNQWVNTETATTSRRCAAISEFVADNSAQTQSLGELLEEVQYGISSKCTNQKRDGLNPVLRIPNVIGEKIDFTNLAWTDPTDDDSKYRLETGDVLIVRTNGNPDYVGRTAVFEGSNFPKCLFASYLIRLKARKEVLLPEFLHEMLAGSSIKKAIRRQVKSSAGNYNLNTVGIRSLRIPVPSLEVQRKLLGELKNISDMQEMIRTLISRCNQISSRAVNNLLG